VLLIVNEADRVVVKSANSDFDCYLTHNTQSILMKLGSSTANPNISTLSIAETAGQHAVGEIQDTIPDLWCLAPLFLESHRGS
jgi:hypothetical protein